MRGPRTAMRSGPRLPQLEKSPSTETKTQHSNQSINPSIKSLKKKKKKSHEIPLNQMSPKGGLSLPHKVVLRINTGLKLWMKQYDVLNLL